MGVIAMLNFLLFQIVSSSIHDMLRYSNPARNLIQASEKCGDQQFIIQRSKNLNLKVGHLTFLSKWAKHFKWEAGTVNKL
mmetsp:Transcript_26348/g.48045  ORF Transcript_26348/g.48045 Transcript_26348/m.48045 type:complete len:80 (-) Transcript_26348:20-259(-)